MSKRKAKPPEILWVEILEAKPNPLFTEHQRQSVRFLRYNQHITCAECGKKRRLMWTMLTQFHCVAVNSFVVAKFSTKSHAPLTPVCSNHIIGPDWPKPMRKSRNRGRVPTPQTANS